MSIHLKGLAFCTTLSFDKINKNTSTNTNTSYNMLQYIYLLWHVRPDVIRCNPQHNVNNKQQTCMQCYWLFEAHYQVIQLGDIIL